MCLIPDVSRYKSGRTGESGKCLIPDIFPGAASITGIDFKL